MVNLNQKKLSTDKKTFTVGPGNRWKEVYDYLTPYNLAIVGGRVSRMIKFNTLSSLLMPNRRHMSESADSHSAEVSVITPTSTA